jgi:hypothetical protein
VTNDYEQGLIPLSVLAGEVDTTVGELARKLEGEIYLNSVGIRCAVQAERQLTSLNAPHRRPMPPASAPGAPSWPPTTRASRCARVRALQEAQKDNPGPLWDAYEWQ